MNSVDFKGARIHYTEEGKGPAVILIHGFLENSSMWAHIGAALSRAHRVVCVDLPGHGQSECVGYVHQMDEMADAVRCVMRNLKIRKADLVGHSMGGYVALAFAEKYPDDVRSLVLYQSSPLADSDERILDRNRAIELVKANASSYVRKSVRALFAPRSLKAFRTEVEEVVRQALKTTPQGIIAAISGMRDRPNRSLLLTFPPYPVHFVVSDLDPRVPIEVMIELSRVSPLIQLHMINGVGHMSYIEAKEETIAILQGILKI